MSLSPALISLLVISVDLSKSVLFSFFESVTDCGPETESLDSPCFECKEVNGKSVPFLHSYEGKG